MTKQKIVPDKKWNNVSLNPEKNWREVWENRIKISRFDSEKSAVNFQKKNQKNYKQELVIDIHPKDGYVVYYD